MSLLYKNIYMSDGANYKVGYFKDESGVTIRKVQKYGLYNEDPKTWHLKQEAIDILSK